MAKLTLAPEDDEPEFHQGPNFDLSRRPDVADVKTPAPSHPFTSHFNPKKVGFGLLPWPGVHDDAPVPAPVSETVAIALQYLLEGPSYSDKEGKR